MRLFDEKRRGYRPKSTPRQLKQSGDDTIAKTGEDVGLAKETEDPKAQGSRLSSRPSRYSTVVPEAEEVGGGALVAEPRMCAPSRFKISHHCFTMAAAAYGAPILLYRNHESYTEQDASLNYGDPGSLLREQRARFRWYYPVDSFCDAPAEMPDETTGSKIFTQKRRDSRREMLVATGIEAPLRKRMLKSLGKADSNYASLKDGSTRLKRDKIARDIQRASERRHFTEYPIVCDQYLLKSMFEREAKQQKKNASTTSLDDPNHPRDYGNCLQVFACQCSYCRDRGPVPTQCVLHPTGPLLDTITISPIQYPHNHTIDPKPIREAENVRDIMRDFGQRSLGLDSALLQIEACGDGKYLVRTALNCLLIRVSLREGTAKGCSSLLHLIEVLAKIDRRSLVQSKPSFTPVDISCHPRYSQGVMKTAKVAVLSKDRNNRVNTIHHALIGDVSQLNEHDVCNMAEISLIDFSAHNPMLLWAAGRSFVQPVIQSSRNGVKPRFGLGHSLYTVDLRQSKANFQWSPSAQTYTVEGVMSISGVMTDWSREHCLYASSETARRFWELDSRMPCKVVETWSLPFAPEAMIASDDASLYSTRLIHKLPQELGFQNFSMLSVCTRHDIGNIHVYGKDLGNRYFGTSSTEYCSPLSNPHPNGRNSMLLELPDSGPKSFVIGLASFVTRFECLEVPDENGPSVDLQKSDHGDSATACIMSLTNRGDVHCHLLSSKDRLPPSENTSEVERRVKKRILSLRPTTTFPRRSDSIVPGFYDIVDETACQSQSSSDSEEQIEGWRPFQRQRRTTSKSIFAPATGESKLVIDSSDTRFQHVQRDILSHFDIAGVKTKIESQTRSDLTKSTIAKSMENWDDNEDEERMFVAL